MSNGLIASRLEIFMCLWYFLVFLMEIDYNVFKIKKKKEVFLMCL